MFTDANTASQQSAGAQVNDSEKSIKESIKQFITSIKRRALQPQSAPVAREAKKAVETPCTVEAECGPVRYLFSKLHRDRTELERMAVDPQTPFELLQHIAHHPFSEIRALVADNSKAPVEVLWALAADADVNVRYELAENPRVPREILGHLSNDDNPYVACRAQKTMARL